MAAGRGVFPVAASVPEFYPRPDIAYIPFDDAPAIEWAPVWLKTNTTARVHALVRAAHAACRPTTAAAEEPADAHRATDPSRPRRLLSEDSELP
ncbi:hypothetical protein [Streptomyces poonensis]|uniref:hypothetical protein n=1 Tax=Streptomyces poonensis TaxID=68255 RepID=UPI001672D923|nr:hypothetical protein [Streptomyces poonensis]